MLFKKEKKKDLLKGRKISYLSENIIKCNKGYLTNILNGKKTCSKRLAKDIIDCIGDNEKIEDYFVEQW